jgi:Fe-S-cluster-containing hydrogenase component 2
VKRISVDETYCTGCRYCEVICSLAHEGEVSYRRARIRVFSDALEGVDRPVLCDPVKCESMPCVPSCPTNAIKVDEKLDYPLIDMEACIGCKACLTACPVKAIFFDEERGKALKCDLCGGDPECVKRCVAHVYLPHIPSPVLQYK